MKLKGGGMIVNLIYAQSKTTTSGIIPETPNLARGLHGILMLTLAFIILAILIFLIFCFLTNCCSFLKGFRKKK